MITQYLSLLSTIAPSGHEGDRRSVPDVIDTIGNYFSDQVLTRPFNPDPVLSFRLDDEVEENVKKLIGAAMNQGAFVLLRNLRDPTRAGSIEDKRVRLSHLLAPLYRLPLITGRPVALSANNYTYDR
jgi:hypothetical protein